MGVQSRLFQLFWSRCQLKKAFKNGSLLKAAKYEIQKPSTCRATMFRCKFWSMFPVFHLAWSTWSTTKTFVAGWRNVARWLVDLLGHEQICCATSCDFDEKRATKPKFVAQSRPALYFSQHLSSTCNKMLLLHDKLITQGEKRETSTIAYVGTATRKLHRRQLATKQRCATSWGFLYLVFRRLLQFINFYVICAIPIMSDTHPDISFNASPNINILLLVNTWRTQAATD